MAKAKSGKTYLSDEFDRYLGALNEVHSDNLKAIREGFDAVNARFDRMDDRFDQIDKRLDSHTEMIGQLMVDMTEVKGRVKRIEGSNLEQRVKILESRR